MTGRVWRLVDARGVQHGDIWVHPPDRLAVLLVRAAGHHVHVEVADLGEWHRVGLDVDEVRPARSSGPAPG